MSISGRLFVVCFHNHNGPVHNTENCESVRTRELDRVEEEILSSCFV